MKQDWLSHGILNPTLLGQKAVKIASNVCFAFFVLTVVLFTILAVTYQPPDPFLQSAKGFAKLLTTPQNATYVPDDSVVITTEDMGSLPANLLPPAISEATIEKASEETVQPDASCEVGGAINCSDPGVLTAIEKFNLDNFPSLVFYEYRLPVRGSDDTECDVAWKYRAGKDGSPRMFREFRRYAMDLQESCEYTVKKAGGWHSGVNARPTKRTRRVPPQDHPSTIPVTLDANVSVAEIGVDVFDVSLPSPSETAFRQGKYLFYSRGGDYCKGMGHYMWSLLCALGEAKYLNRVFVLDLEICLSGSNNEVSPGKDFRYYFDFDHLQASLPVLDQNQFLKDWDAWDSKHAAKIQIRDVDVWTTPMSLKDDQSTILKRVFNEPEPNNYWFKVCEGETENVIQRPWDFIWKSRRINDIVLAICARMDWDFDALHVVRGDKIKNKDLWPNLDRDTSSEALVSKLESDVAEGRNVYIATNEQEKYYFDKLRGKWKIFTLDDFQDLWADDSDWAKAIKELNNGNLVEFDSYMRVEVDSEVMYKSKKRIETFSDLTKDCKGGLGTC